MNALQETQLPAFAHLVVSALPAVFGGAEPARGQAPTLTPSASPAQVRGNQDLTGGFAQAVIKMDHFPNQFTVIPKDGDKETAGDAELTWHGLDPSDFNVDLYRLAYDLKEPR